MHVWDNSGLSEHRKVMEETERVRIWPETVIPLSRIAHAEALDRLIAVTSDDVEFLVLLDTDAIPIADGWLGTLTAKLDEGGAIVGVWRDEMAPELTPFVHVSCLCIRREEMLRSGVSFAERGDSEPGQILTRDLLRRKRPVVAMRRTNTTNAHFLLGGIYGDTVYHHGAGAAGLVLRLIEPGRGRADASATSSGRVLRLRPPCLRPPRTAQKTTFGPSTTNPPELTTRLGTVRPIPPPSRRPIPS